MTLEFCFGFAQSQLLYSTGLNSRVYYTRLLWSFSEIIYEGYLAQGLAYIFYAINVTFRRSFSVGGIHSDSNSSNGGGGRCICYYFNSNKMLITNMKNYETNCPIGNIFVVLPSEFESILRVPFQVFFFRMCSHK